MCFCVEVVIERGRLKHSFFTVSEMFKNEDRESYLKESYFIWSMSNINSVSYKRELDPGVFG